MKIAGFGDVDLIDLCPLCPGVDSLAVAALGRDGSIILCRDVLNDSQAKTFNFPSIKGVAYRLLCHAGDLYVLTSQALYVLGRLGSHFLSSERTENITTQIMPLTLEAVDMNLAWGRWLLVVRGDQVLKFDVNLIHDFVPVHTGNGEIKEFRSIAPSIEPHWEDITTTTTSMALAG